jgi:nucleoside-diphosphate-sugar epimerase
MTPQTVFLTGTGTVGREVLLALLRQGHRVAILMRDRGRKTAARRAAALFDDLELDATERASVEVVPGDITLDRLGLDVDVHARLTRTLDVIVHTAATTSLTADRALCESVNCTGTANTLMLADRCFAEGRLTRYLYLSTALVAGADSSAVALEDELPASPAHANYYEWSKYDAERVVRAAMHAGLPVTIFRPSMVVGDTGTGRTRDFNVIYPLMRIMASGYVTRFPAAADGRVHLAPRDFVVDGIIRSLDAPWSIGRTFHLTSPDPPSVRDLFVCDAFFPTGAPRPVLCPPDEFDLASCSPRERDLLESVSFCFPYFNSHLAFDTSNAGRLVPLPVTDMAYLERLGRYALEIGYIRAAVA